jgi:hypothetical protein
VSGQVAIPQTVAVSSTHCRACPARSQSTLPRKAQRAPPAGSAWPDASPADPGRRDAHVHVAGAARPRLEVCPVLQALHFALVCDLVRVTLHQDAPALPCGIAGAAARGPGRAGRSAQGGIRKAVTGLTVVDPGR